MIPTPKIKFMCAGCGTEISHNRTVSHGYYWHAKCFSYHTEKMPPPEPDMTTDQLIDKACATVVLKPHSIEPDFTIAYIGEHEFNIAGPLGLKRYIEEHFGLVPYGKGHWQPEPWNQQRWAVFTWL